MEMPKVKNYNKIYSLKSRINSLKIEIAALPVLKIKLELAEEELKEALKGE